MKYISDHANIADLTPNILISEVEIPVNKLHSSLSELLNYYDKPVVSEDNIVLTHWESVLSAKERQSDQIEIVRVVGLDANYYLPFISFDYIFKEKSTLFRYRHLKALTEFLKNNPVGKKWRDKAPVNNFLAEVMGVDVETIKLYNRIMKRTVGIGKPEDHFFKLGLPITKILPEIENIKTGTGSRAILPQVNINPDERPEPAPSFEDLQPAFAGKLVRFNVRGKVVEFEASLPVIMGNKAVYTLLQAGKGQKTTGQLILPVTMLD